MHTHILPGVDDGPKTMEAALELLEMAQKDGIQAVILTPHYRGRYRADAAQIGEVFADLCREAEKRSLSIRLFLGNEIYLNGHIMEALEQGRLRSMNDSQYVLLEFGDMMLRNQILEGISQAVRWGYTPIIAHLERYELFRKEPDLVEAVLDLGALIQLNADSVMGRQGFFIKRFCCRLLKQGQVHFIASDAHDGKKRPPLLGACRRWVQRKYGTAVADAIFRVNPHRVICNHRL